LAATLVKVHPWVWRHESVLLLHSDSNSLTYDVQHPGWGISPTAGFLSLYYNKGRREREQEGGTEQKWKCIKGLCLLKASACISFTLLTPWSRVLLVKLTAAQLFKKFLAFYVTRRFITVFTTARHWSLFWAARIQSTRSHPIPLRSILILSSHLRLSIRVSGFLPKMLQALHLKCTFSNWLPHDPGPLKQGVTGFTVARGTTLTVTAVVGSTAVFDTVSLNEVHVYWRQMAGEETET
jgi:hypothetical protein